LIAVDTNLLVYAHRQDSKWHEAAAGCVRDLAESPSTWAIPWPCIHEFYAVVTHRRIYDPPSTPRQALAQIDAWLQSPSLLLIAENGDSWGTLATMLETARITGARVHDGRIASICIANGARELWSADRDFSSFPGLRTRNPLV
jgi:toxin-antitoxin system PIN domain toxin